MKTVVHASKSKRKRELDEDYKSIEEQHYLCNQKKSSR